MPNIDLNNAIQNAALQLFQTLCAYPESGLSQEFQKIAQPLQTEEGQANLDRLAPLASFFKAQGINMDDFVEVAESLLESPAAWAGFADHCVFNLLTGEAESATSVGQVIFDKDLGSRNPSNGGYAIAYTAPNGGNTPLYYTNGKLVSDPEQAKPTINLYTTYLPNGLSSEAPAIQPALYGSVNGQQSVGLNLDETGSDDETIWQKSGQFIKDHWKLFSIVAGSTLVAGAIFLVVKYVRRANGEGGQEGQEGQEGQGEPHHEENQNPDQAQEQGNPIIEEIHEAVVDIPLADNLPPVIPEVQHIQNAFPQLIQDPIKDKIIGLEEWVKKAGVEYMAQQEVLVTFQKNWILDHIGDQVYVDAFKEQYKEAIDQKKMYEKYAHEIGRDAVNIGRKNDMNIGFDAERLKSLDPFKKNENLQYITKIKDVWVNQKRISKLQNELLEQLKKAIEAGHVELKKNIEKSINQTTELNPYSMKDFTGDLNKIVVQSLIDHLNNEISTDKLGNNFINRNKEAGQDIERLLDMDTYDDSLITLEKQSIEQNRIQREASREKDELDVKLDNEWNAKQEFAQKQASDAKAAQQNQQKMDMLKEKMNSAFHKEIREKPWEVKAKQQWRLENKGDDVAFKQAYDYAYKNQAKIDERARNLRSLAGHEKFLDAIALRQDYLTLVALDPSDEQEFNEKLEILEKSLEITKQPVQKQPVKEPLIQGQATPTPWQNMEPNDLIEIVKNSANYVERNRVRYNKDPNLYRKYFSNKDTGDNDYKNFKEKYKEQFDLQRDINEMIEVLPFINRNLVTETENSIIKMDKEILAGINPFSENAESFIAAIYDTHEAQIKELFRSKRLPDNEGITKLINIMNERKLRLDNQKRLNQEDKLKQGELNPKNNSNEFLQNEEDHVSSLENQQLIEEQSDIQTLQGEFGNSSELRQMQSDFRNVNTESNNVNFNNPLDAAKQQFKIEEQVIEIDQSTNQFKQSQGIPIDPTTQKVIKAQAKGRNLADKNENIEEEHSHEHEHSIEQVHIE